MFLGTHQHTLDAKGRLVLPAAFRDRLQGDLVFAPGQDRCIEVSRTEDFEARYEALSAAPRETQRVRMYQRMLLSRAAEVTPDGQGRVLIPTELRTYAGLDRDVTVNGAGTHLEIWDRGRWQEYAGTAEVDFANFDAVLAG